MPNITLTFESKLVGGSPPSVSAPPYFEWDYPSLSTGQVITTTVLAKVLSGANGQVVHNTASSIATGLVPGTSNDAPFTIFTPGTELTKTVSKATANIGDLLTYSLHYFNPAPAPVSGFDLQVSDNGSAWTSGQMAFSFSVSNYSGAVANLAGPAPAWP